MPAPESRQRQTGSYYTPEWLARWMVRRTLNGLTREQASQATFLDPACGDGAFLLPLLEQLAEPLTPTTVVERLNLARRCLFGVDADPVAIKSVRDRVARWIGSEPLDADVDRVLQKNVLCGDALLGRGLSSDESNSSPSGIDWPTAFPQASLHGGFDVVIGNPPYRRERYAKADFDRICSTPWGERWRRPRMDLWHFFAHRGIDLLKPGGTLTFIVNSYWMESTAATTLRDRIQQELALEEVVLLGDVALFPGVAGRHMIFRGRKVFESQPSRSRGERLDQASHAAATTDCRVVDLSGCSADKQCQILSRDVSGDGGIDESFQARIAHQELWLQGRLQLPRLEHSERKGTTRQTASRTSLPTVGPRLGELFLVRQGIAENPPFVTKAIARELGTGCHVGEGVFVLTDAELTTLKLNDRERQVVRPYYALSSLGRFRIAQQPTHWLLYLTKQTAPSLESLPNIAAHLTPFRQVLERRREVKSGSISWWYLHWPRTQRLFTDPRVLCVQMGRVPQFVFVEQPTFVGFSAHVVVAKPEDEVHADSKGKSICDVVRQPSLAALSAILNSSPAKGWFEVHAKHRGVHLDISGTVLRQFPLPRFLTSKHDAALGQLAARFASHDQAGEVSNQDCLEAELNRLVIAAYSESDSSASR